MKNLCECLSASSFPNHLWHLDRVEIGSRLDQMNDARPLSLETTTQTGTAGLASFCHVVLGTPKLINHGILNLCGLSHRCRFGVRQSMLFRMMDLLVCQEKYLVEGLPALASSSPCFIASCILPVCRSESLVSSLRGLFTFRSGHHALGHTDHFAVEDPQAAKNQESHPNFTTSPPHRLQHSASIDIHMTRGKQL